MTRRLALLGAAIVAVGAGQGAVRGAFGQEFPPGRPFPWAEVIASVLTISLLLWAAHLRRDE
jgi:hypothetical protein